VTFSRFIPPTDKDRQWEVLVGHRALLVVFVREKIFARVSESRMHLLSPAYWTFTDSFAAAPGWLVCSFVVTWPLSTCQPSLIKGSEKVERFWLDIAHFLRGGLSQTIRLEVAIRFQITWHESHNCQLIGSNGTNMRSLDLPAYNAVFQIEWSNHDEYLHCDLDILPHGLGIRHDR